MRPELEQVAQGYEALSPDVRDRWAIEQIKTIRNTVAKDLTVAEFQMGMAVAAKYDLDPLLHEIWFAKSKSQDGGPGRAMIMAGRDGFLKIARNRKDYKGMDCDVVRAKDEFRVMRKSDGERAVEHSYTGSDIERGEIRGAWAIVYFEGKVPFYYYAPLSEYKPRRANDRSTWATQTSVMMLKCAQSYALRIACGISGMVGEEEAAKALEPPAQTTELSEVLGEVWPDLRERLRQAYGRAQDLRPGEVTLAALQIHTKGQTYEKVAAYLAEIEQANEQAQPPDAEEVRADQALPEGEDRESYINRYVELLGVDDHDLIGTDALDAITDELAFLAEAIGSEGVAEAHARAEAEHAS